MGKTFDFELLIDYTATFSLGQDSYLSNQLVAVIECPNGRLLRYKFNPEWTFNPEKVIPLEVSQETRYYDRYKKCFIHPQEVAEP